MDGVMVTGSLLPNVMVSYECTDNTNFVLVGSTDNQCDEQGMYMNLVAPTCLRSK